jgi:triphosphatase
VPGPAGSAGGVEPAAVESPREPPGQAGATALRLALPPDEAPRLRRHPLLSALDEGRPSRSVVSLLYYDTERFDLLHAGLALRVRRAGRHYVQTLEVLAPPGLGPSVRRELDALVPDERPEPGAIPDLDLRDRVAGRLAGRPLTRAFEVHLDRSRRALREDESTLRVDLEVGEIHTAGGVVPVCELELLARGPDPSHPHRLALELLESVPLRPMTRSFAERAWERVSGRGPATHRASRLAVPEDPVLEALLVAVVTGCIDQVVANEPAASLGVDPEGVHQMRVGARRLRSALAFFAPVLPERQREGLRAELRWLARQLGAARDLDVFVTELLDPLAAVRPDDAALAALRAAAQDRRAVAHGRVRDSLASLRWSRLTLELGGWLARRAWREQALSESAATLFLPARSFAAEVLERRHRKARKLGRHLATASPAQRHQLRIRLKKLRYAAEYSAALWPGRRGERYVRRLSRLQDVLGHLNDGATAERLLGEIGARLGGPEAVHAAGFAAGWVAHAARVELEHLPRRWRRFVAAGRFW